MEGGAVPRPSGDDGGGGATAVRRQGQSLQVHI